MSECLAFINERVTGANKTRLPRLRTVTGRGVVRGITGAKANVDKDKCTLFSYHNKEGTRV